MAKLKEVLESVHEHNRSIIEEVCEVLPKDIDYTLITSKNLAFITQQLKEIKCDKSVLNLEEYVLLGDAELYPCVRFSGDLLCLYLHVCKYIGDYVKEDILLVYEKDNRIR